MTESRKTKLPTNSPLTGIPFNLFYSSRLFNPFHQNVLFTLLLGLLAIRTISLCVFGALVILLIIMILRRDVLFAKVNGFAEKKGSPAAKNTVHKPNGFVRGLLYHAIRFYYSLCGIHIKAANNVGTLQQPSRLLLNRASKSRKSQYLCGFASTLIAPKSP